MSVAKNLGLTRERFLLPGHAACHGCGLAINFKIVLKVLGKKTILVIPACCSSVIQGPYPKVAFNAPTMNIAFASTGAAISGVSRALKIRGVKDVLVVGWAGDGGTVDIGIQALSGAAERGENILYICYDNQAYMNTGIQRSGSTPYGAWTTTTPIVGKKQFPKDLPLIMAAHRIPYVATASMGYLADMIGKLRKAKEARGPRYIHLFSPCPVGWRHDSAHTVRIAKLAVDTWVWPLYEVENGKVRVTVKPRRKPLKEYISLQGRFKRLTDEEIKLMEDEVVRRFEMLLKMEESGIVF